MFARAFHGHLRAQKCPDYNVWFGHSKSCSATHYKFDVSLLRELVSLEFTAGLLYYGDDLFMPKDSTTQGSSFSPGLCLLTTAFLESQSVAVFTEFEKRTNSRLRLNLFWKRWMDDIFLIVQLWRSKECDKQLAETECVSLL